MKIIIPCLAAALILFSCLPQGNRVTRYNLKNDLDANRIRVLIVKTKSQVVIGSSEKIVIRDKETARLLKEIRDTTVAYTPGDITRPITIDAWDSPVTVNGIGYNGNLEVHDVLGSLCVINILHMRDYLCSVVPSEIPSRWNTEALKAQAVASRTYAYYHIQKNKKNRLYDLDSTTSFQVYKGISSHTTGTSDAVAATSGEVVTHKGSPILAYFHSTCGGKTADDRYIWAGGDEAYLRSVSCAYCKESPHYEWNARLSLQDIRDSLEKADHRLGNIKSISFRIKSGRVTDVMIRHSLGLCNLPGNTFRLLFATDRVKSTCFKSKREGKSLLISGRGWGHGVGLCQWGAKGMAEKGRTYKKILHYYYPGGNVEKIRYDKMLD